MTLVAAPPRHSLVPELSALQADNRHLRETCDELREEVAMLRRTLANEDEHDRAAAIAATVGFSRTEVRLLTALMAGRAVSRDALYQSLYGARVEADQPDPTVINVFVCRIKQRLRPKGIKINTVRGIGWRIAPDELAKLYAMLPAPPRTATALRGNIQ